jgi:hypothetical protein
MNAGWLVDEISLGQSRVTFRRTISTSSVGFGSSPEHVIAAPAGILRSTKVNLQSPDESVDHPTAAGVSTLLALGWIRIGTVRLDTQGKLVFPSLQEEPGIYRFQFARGGATHAYVGETDRLRRRLHHYRNPGPTQRTNICINALLKEVLREGIMVELEVLQNSLDFNDFKVRQTLPDRSLKSERVACENAALLAMRQSKIVILNA